MRAALGAGRERAFARLPDLLGITRGLSVVDGFRAAVAGLRAEAGLAHEATIVGAFPVIAGALVQRVKGNDPIAPDPTANHAADTLSMMLGRKPNAREAAALDAYFVTVCDHGMNASTFTTRVVASTQADLFAAVTAGYCALTGPLHGGAPERHNVREVLRALLWGLALPAGIVVMTLLHPAWLLLLLAYPLQVLRLALRDNIADPARRWRALFFVLARFPEAQGVLQFWFNRLRRNRSALIEYK